MEFRRINEDTVRCIIDEDDMMEYDIGLEDFIRNDEKVTEFLHSIIEMAQEEVDYKPDNGMLAMQVTPMPENKLAITFSENNKDGVSGLLHKMQESLKNLASIPEKLDEEFSNMSDEEKAETLDKMMKQAINDAVNQTDEDEYQAKNQHMDFREVKSEEDPTPNKETSCETKRTRDSVIVDPSFIRIYEFFSLEQVIKFCKKIQIEDIPSGLYKDVKNDTFIMIFEKGDYEDAEFASVCGRATEFGRFCSDSIYYLLHVKEHYKCMIKEYAVKQIKQLD